MKPKPKPTVLVLTGILIGCATAAVTRSSAPPARAAGAVEQYCTTSGDFNNIAAVNDVVKRAGEKGWELIGVYRPVQLGATFEDYVCFHRPRAE
jgi:hypothetical protein